MRALAAAVLALLAAAPAAQAAFPGRNGRIAVTDGAVTVVKANGRAPHRITDPRTFAPRWSPDGRRIAFVAAEGEGYVIRIANADGSDPRAVPLPFAGLDPAWSPDGERLLITRGTGERLARRDIYSVKPDGTGLERLVPNALEPSWSPDGGQIAYITIAGDGCRRLALAWADGTGRRVLADRIPDDARCAPSPTERAALSDRGAAFTPDWRPDGQAVVYGSDGAAIEVDRDDSGRTRTLARTKAENLLWPRYSPDGRRLVFSDGTGARWSAWTITLGSAKRRLRGGASYPDWQPLP